MMKFTLRFLLAILVHGMGQCSVAFAALNDVDKQEVFAKNILKNGGFENGKAGWAASGGTFATVTSGTNLLTGKVSATWDSSGAAQTLSRASIEIPKGLYGKNGVAACKIQTPSGTATHTFSVTDGSSTLVSSAVTSNAGPAYEFRNFQFPSSGSLVLTFTSVAADEPLIAIDDCFVGDASEVNLTNVSQASFIGSAYFPFTANCTFTRTSSTLGPLADTDCPGPTVEFNPGPGVIQTTDANAPIVTLNNLPPGDYEVGYVGASAIATSAQVSALAISDGTTTSGQSGANRDLNANQFHVVGYFHYTDSGNRSFELYAASVANAFNIALTTSTDKLQFYIKRFPNATQLAVTPDQSANSWSGYHSGDCGWARTNTAYGDPAADATCTFTERTNTNFGTVTSALSGSDKLPGLVFTPKKVQKYEICANIAITGSVTGGGEGFTLIDGSANTLDSWYYQQAASLILNTRVCTFFTPTSVASQTIKFQTKASSGSVTLGGNTTDNSIVWSIKAIDQSMPAPLLVNSVVSNSSGVTKTIAAKLNCDSGSAITSQSGTTSDGVASIGNISAGACAITLATGTFSDTPWCVAQEEAIDATPRLLNLTITSSTAMSVDCATTAAAACTAYDIHLICMGAN